MRKVFILAGRSYDLNGFFVEAFSTMEKAKARQASKDFDEMVTGSIIWELVIDEAVDNDITNQ